MNGPFVYNNTSESQTQKLNITHFVLCMKLDDKQFKNKIKGREYNQGD